MQDQTLYAVLDEENGGFVRSGLFGQQLFDSEGEASEYATDDSHTVVAIEEVQG